MSGQNEVEKKVVRDPESGRLEAGILKDIHVNAELTQGDGRN